MNELIYTGIYVCPFYKGVQRFEKRKCSCPNPKTDAIILCDKNGELKAWQCRLTCEFYEQFQNNKKEE